MILLATLQIFQRCHQAKLVNMNVLRVNKYYLLVQGKQYKKLNLKGKEKEIITIKAHEDKPTEAI